MVIIKILNMVSDLPSTYLAIVIMSSPDDAIVRAVIRNTWLKLSSKGDLEYIFIL